MDNNKKHMPFTSEQIKQAYESNIISFAQANGMEVERTDRKAVYIKDSGGLCLYHHGRGYYCFATGSKGNIVDFAKEYFNVDFKGAIEMILGCKAYDHVNDLQDTYATQEVKQLELPQKDNSYKRVIAYLLNARALEKKVVYDMINAGKIYQAKTELNGNTYTNCAFVGYDNEGIAKYCSLRGMSDKSSFKQDCAGSDKSYPFVIDGKENAEIVYVFESPIDALSHASAEYLVNENYKTSYRIAEGGLSGKGLERFLKNHNQIKQIHFCYDNDKDGRLADGTPHNHGQERAKKMAEQYKEKGYETHVIKPYEKDMNEDLKLYRKYMDPNTQKDFQAINWINEELQTELDYGNLY